MQSKISVIIPIIRPQRATICIKSVYENAGIDKEDLEIIAEEDLQRIGAPKMVKHLVEKTRYDLVCFVGDDTVMQENCIKYALEAMNSFEDGWGLVALNDGLREGKVAAHWLAHKKLLPFLNNEFFNTKYKHCWTDNEFSERCKEMNRYIFAEKARIAHNHPVNDMCYDDEHYRRVYSDDYLVHDMMLYRKRKRNNWKD